MSNYLPDGCTQDMLDRALDGLDDLPEPDEQDPVWWDEAEHSEQFNDVDERATHLAAGIEHRLAGSVESPLANVPDGLGFE